MLLKTLPVAPLDPQKVQKNKKIWKKNLALHIELFLARLHMLSFYAARTLDIQPACSLVSLRPQTVYTTKVSNTFVNTFAPLVTGVLFIGDQSPFHPFQLFLYLCRLT
jgi:DNA helicase TIP49 (TBP-interacting protein)